MMTLQIHFSVSTYNSGAFRRMYEEDFAPALSRQRGYLESRLLEIFPNKMAEDIYAAPTKYNYQLELIFDTEEHRQRWATSKEHENVWSAATALAEEVAWRAFFVRGRDEGLARP